MAAIQRFQIELERFQTELLYIKFSYHNWWVIIGTLRQTTWSWAWYWLKLNCISMSLDCFGKFNRGISPELKLLSIDIYRGWYMDLFTSEWVLRIDTSTPRVSTTKSCLVTYILAPSVSLPLLFFFLSRNDSFIKSGFKLVSCRQTNHTPLCLQTPFFNRWFSLTPGLTDLAEM